MAKPDLSLAAELLLLSIDPARGGLVRRRRARFRRALAAASNAGRAAGRLSRWTAWRARVAALAEVERAGIVEVVGLRRSPRVLDKRAAAEPFHRLRRCIRTNEFPRARDRDLLLMLAWSGVLTSRLSREDRRLALRRLPTLARPIQPGDFGHPPLSGGPPVWEGIGALGTVAALGGAELVIQGAMVDLSSAEAGAFDVGGPTGSGDVGN